MSPLLIRCHRLAQQIERVHAKALAKVARSTWTQEYDTLTATVLGDLIYSTLRAEPRKEKP